MIDPYLIRSRLFLALGVPAALCPLLHAWAIVEGRKFCHEFMGELLCLAGSEKAVRIAVGRKLDALSLFSKTSGYDLGCVQRGGDNRARKITSYGAFNPNRAALWIQKQISSDPGVSKGNQTNPNPIVAVDLLTAEAIARHVPKAVKLHGSHLTSHEKPGTKKKNKNCVCVSKTKKKRVVTEQESGYYRHTLGLRTEALLAMPDCTFPLALKLVNSGFPIFAAWGVAGGVCRCPLGSDCKNPGKHPIPRGWQQIATAYTPTLVKFWERHPFANVGIATGRRMPNGEHLTVIDCDFRHFGHGTLSALERGELCPLPLTREHSAGGGPHKFFTHPRGFRSGPGALGQGIDVQCFGKFVIGAGMNARGKSYEITVDAPIARLPDAWADQIDAVKNKTLPLIAEGQRRAKLLSWAGGMARDGLAADLIAKTLRDRSDRRFERGSHWFTDSDLEQIATYCLTQERSKQRERAA